MGVVNCQLDKWVAYTLPQLARALAKRVSFVEKMGAKKGARKMGAKKGARKNGSKRRGTKNKGHACCSKSV